MNYEENEGETGRAILIQANTFEIDTTYRVFNEDASS